MFTPSTPKTSKTLGFVNVKLNGKSLPLTISVTDSSLFDALVNDPTLFARIVQKSEVSVKSNVPQSVGIDWNSL